MTLPQELQQEYARLIRRTETAEANRDFFCSFPFPDKACLQDFLKTAAKNGITRLSFEQNGSFGSTAAVWLAESLSLVPDLEALNLNGRKTGKKGTLALLKALPATKIKDLSLNEIEFSKQAEPMLFDAIKKMPLEKLSLARIKTGNEKRDFAEKMAKILPDTNISDLNISGVYSSERACEKPAACLPLTRLTALRFDCMKGEKAQNALIDNLEKTGITRLHMDGCYNFKEPEAIRLMQVLPQTDVSFLYFSMYPKYGLPFFRKTAKMLSTPSVRLEQGAITMFHTSPEKHDPVIKARDALMKNVVYRKAVAAKAAKNLSVEKADPSLSLGEALENGFLKQALNARKEPLNVTECLKPDGYGTTLLQKAARAEQLAVLFDAAYWNNAKEHHAAWTAAGKEHHWQMDGKKGRPSYQKVKNEIMKRSVCSLIKNKGKDAER